MTRERKTKPRSSLTEASKEGVKILRAIIDKLREGQEKRIPSHWGAEVVDGGIY